MRLTKEKVQTLRNNLSEKLFAHPVYKEALAQRQEVIYLAVLHGDPVAATLTGIVDTLPKIVKDQLPKRSYVRFSFRADDYKTLVKALAEKDGITDMPPYPFEGYQSTQVDFPPGRVLYSESANELPSFSQDKPASRSMWRSVALAQHRVKTAQDNITRACNHLEQLAYELVNLDALIDKVPVVRDIIPASWLAPAEEQPKNQLVDEETAARLRALILGEKA